MDKSNLALALITVILGTYIGGALLLAAAAPVGATQAFSRIEESLVDMILILLVAVLYGATHWLAAALARLGGAQ